MTVQNTVYASRDVLGTFKTGVALTLRTYRLASRRAGRHDTGGKWRRHGGIEDQLSEETQPTIGAERLPCPGHGW